MYLSSETKYWIVLLKRIALISKKPTINNCIQEFRRLGDKLTSSQRRRLRQNSYNSFKLRVVLLSNVDTVISQSFFWHYNGLVYLATCIRWFICITVARGSRSIVLALNLSCIRQGRVVLQTVAFFLCRISFLDR